MGGLAAGTSIDYLELYWCDGCGLLPQITWFSIEATRLTPFQQITWRSIEWALRLDCLPR